jgi:hypothetical protein
MRTKAYKNGLVIGVIFLFIGISIIPITSSMDVVKEKNNSGVVNFQKLNTPDMPFGRYVRKIYFIGKIQNLTVQRNDYEFESNNIRKLEYWRSGIRSWGFSYDHYVDGYSCGIGGFNFRGILKPNFICGVFYA